MNDKKTTIEDLKKLKAQFISEREWSQFHTPKNISMALSVEASELVELFLWCESQDSFDVVKKNQQAVSDEIADIAMYVIAFCNATGIDLSEAVQQKMKKNREKYPVEKVKGKATKYINYNL